MWIKAQKQLRVQRSFIKCSHLNVATAINVTIWNNCSWLHSQDLSHRGASESIVALTSSSSSADDGIRWLVSMLVVTAFLQHAKSLSCLYIHIWSYMTYPHHTDDHYLLMHSSFPFPVWPILSRTGLQRSIPPEEGANIFQVSTFQRVVLVMQSSPGIKNRFNCWLLFATKNQQNRMDISICPGWISSQQ